MSIEQKIDGLIEAINNLTSVMTSAASGEVENSEKSNKNAEKNTSSSDSESSNIAGRKTYVFFKKTKTGAIIEKGEEVPEDATGVSKSKWVELCKKYKLDQETGQPEEVKSEDDLDDDDLDDEPVAEESADDADDGLGLDDDEEGEEEITASTVKQALVDLAKVAGRETSLKVLKKFGAANANNLPEDKLEEIYETAKKLVAKHSK